MTATTSSQLPFWQQVASIDPVDGDRPASRSLCPSPCTLPAETLGLLGLPCTPLTDKGALQQRIREQAYGCISTGLAPSRLARVELFG